MNILSRWGVGLLFQVLLLTVISFASGQYNYDQQGNDWEGLCAEGTNQSPINLTNATSRSIQRIRFYNYDQPLQTPLVLSNNGHTANLALTPTRNGQRAYINGGLLPGTFEAQSVHFHWGSANSLGSEHSVNNQRYDVEMHIVHKNIRYADKTVGEASAFKDGLAVLGVMFTARSGLVLPQAGLINVFNQLPRIITYQSNTTIPGRLTVGQLLGNIELADFFTYNGSLTTPDCAESVTWTVFRDDVDMHIRQIRKLWNLEDSRGRQLINTYRAIQEQNERPLYYRSLQ